MENNYCTAIILAGGSGKRMGTKVHKQYLLMDGKPVLYYPLRAFQDSEFIDEIILVAGSGEEEYCREQIVRKYGMTKVKKIVSGGEQRYDSVWNGLQETRDKGLVFIHDGARPFVDEAIICRGYECACIYRACAAGMPAKDTIKIADANGLVVNTPDRKRVWIVQTPQVFETELIKKAYRLLIEKGNAIVTDDAMVVEQMLRFPTRLFYGAYKNIKITTPEDLWTAESFLKNGY